MKEMYTCPMHSKVKQEHPGKCPHCGMKLVLEKDVHAVHHHKKEENVWQTYTPLLVIISLIFMTTLTLAFRDFQTNDFTWENTIAYFMSGFFIVFSGFKLMDLKGFAEGYATYDLLAKRWFGYGYIYPFIELFFGLSMILHVQTIPILILEIIVMLFSGLGVALKLLKHEKFQCACLGTFLKVPLTKVTLIENFGMAALAGITLYLITC